MWPLDGILYHDVERVGKDYHCRVCGWTWKWRPTGECPGVPRFASYGAGEEAGMFTKTELGRRKQIPGGPVRACVYIHGRPTGQRWQPLYSGSEAIPKPTRIRRETTG